MRVAILVCALAATALAAPKYARSTKLDPKLAPQVQVAEQAWSAAEAERDTTKQTELWERSAIAFGDVDAAPVDTKVKREAAYAALLAWKNALNVDPRAKRTPVPSNDFDHAPKPTPLPERDQKLVTAFDRYVGYMDSTDPEVPGILFLKANLYRRYDQFEVANPILRSLIDRYPRHEVAAHSANLLLDSYNRLQQYDKLVAFAEELAKNTALLRDHDDLAETVQLILRQSMRRRAEKLEKEAKATKDWALYVDAATAYLDIYNADPSSKDNDEILYNAGVAFEEGRSIGEALRMYALLEKHYPNSRLAARTLARTGKLYSDTAMYDKAADKLEQYAKRYPGERDAYGAMSDAIFFRKGLGDRTRAIANTQYFIKAFGVQKPLEAANATWSLTAFYDNDDRAMLAHLEQYLRTFGATSGADRLVIAHAKIGALLWKQSCPHVLVDGLCVKVKTRPRTCGPGIMQTVTATKRNEATLKRSLAAFADAMKEFERKQRAFDDPAVRYFYAQAKLAQGDVDFETYLAIAFPRGLTFDATNEKARTASEKRFAAWVVEKQKLGSAAAKQYDSVLMTKDAASAITAAARLGTLSQTFASELLTSPTSSAGISYCAVARDVAEPLEARAVDAFAVCLAKSTELGWFSDSSSYCERQLLELKPDEFPRAGELRARPAFVAPVIVLESPMRETR